MKQKEIPKLEYSPGSIIRGVITKAEKQIVVEIEVGAMGTNLNTEELLDAARIIHGAESADLVLSESMNSNLSLVPLVNELSFRFHNVTEADEIPTAPEQVEDTEQAIHVQARSGNLLNRIFG